MALPINGAIPRTFDGGMTANQMVEAFVNVRLSGVDELVDKLRIMAIRAQKTSDSMLMAAAKQASKPIRDAYRKKINEVTGNLGKSVVTKAPGQRSKYRGVGVAITGPQVTGPVGADPETGSGNHAWLVEFGTGTRRPGTQGRRTYLNVHQMINGRMRPMGGSNKPFNNSQFEKMGRGYYFLMGSKNERTRQARMGSGYPHDFGSDGPGEMHPITLQPGETIAAMPAQHPMEKTIAETNGQVLNTLINSLQKYIDDLSAA